MNKNNTINITVATYEANDSLGKLLHPDTNHVFSSILGELASSGNGMRFINHTGFKMSWLNRSLTKREYGIMKQGGTRNVPNYWELIKLVLTDRILSDRVLINKLIESVAGDVELKFTCKIKIDKGMMLNQEVDNDKLFIYNVLLGKVVKFIVKEYKEVFDDIDIFTLSIHDLNRLNLDIKEQVWSSVIERTKDVDIAKNLTEISNEELKKIFMSIKHFKV